MAVKWAVEMADEFKPEFDALRSEEHTSELQSRGQIVCRLLLEKKSADIQTRFLVASITVTGGGSAIGFVAGLILAQDGIALFRLCAHAPIYSVNDLSRCLMAG